MSVYNMKPYHDILLYFLARYDCPLAPYDPSGRVKPTLCDQLRHSYALFSFSIKDGIKID